MQVHLRANTLCLSARGIYGSGLGMTCGMNASDDEIRDSDQTIQCDHVLGQGTHLGRKLEGDQIEHSQLHEAVQRG